jgi:hypothetical protein
MAQDRATTAYLRRARVCLETGETGDGSTCCGNGLRISLLGMSELVFEVIQEADGGYCAECLSDTIVTEGNTSEELRRNVQDVVRGFYFDAPEKLPTTIRLHLVRDEVLAVA